MSDSNESHLSFENIKVKGNQLKEKVKEIIEEGSARRIIIQKDGKTLLEFPLAIGLGGAAAAILIHAPLTAVGLIAALATDVQIIVEREIDAIEPSDPDSSNDSEEQID
ncbi:MAG: DUF4342 domain-containing protein [Rhodothermales bacterium]